MVIQAYFARECAWFRAIYADEGSPGPFYSKIGFVETGEIVEDERVMSLRLTYGR